MSQNPTILEVVTSEGNSGKRVTTGGEMEMFITIHGERFQLIGAMLKNRAHWRSVIPVHGSFLRYDGILKNYRQINYMKWLRPDESFGADNGGYSALVYWYMPCERLSPQPQRSLVTEDQLGADTDDNGDADMDEDDAQDNQDMQFNINDAEKVDEGQVPVEGVDDDADEDIEDEGSVEMVGVVPGNDDNDSVEMVGVVPGNDDMQPDIEMLDTTNLYQEYISSMIDRFGLRTFSSLKKNGKIIDEVPNGNCGHLALVRCLSKHGCLFSTYRGLNTFSSYRGENGDVAMTRWRSDLATFWRINFRKFRENDLRLPDWRLVVSYPDGTPLNCFRDRDGSAMSRRVAYRIYRRGIDYDNGADGDQWLEMNEIMSIVSYWKKYSIVVYMTDRGAGLKRTYFFIYDQAEDHVTHVTHSHPTRWLSPPPRSITLHYISNIHFQSYSMYPSLNEIYSAANFYGINTNNVN